MQTKTSYNKKLLLSFILFAFFLTSCYFSFKLNIWEDEVYSLKSTEGNTITAIKQALNFEGQPPVYFITLNLWRHINSSIFFSRLFSLLSIIFSAIIIFKLSKIYIPQINPIFPVLIFLTNPFIMWASTEIRHYPFSILLTLSLLFFYNKGFFSEEKKKTNKFYYYVIAFISFYTFYFFAFLLFANGIYLLIKRKFKVFGYYTLFMVIILIPFFFMYNIIINQFNLHDQTLFPPISISERLKDIGLGTQNYLFALHLLPFNTPEKIIYKIFIAALLIFGLFQLSSEKNRKEVIEDNNAMSLAISIGIIYLLYIIVLKIFTRLYFTDRYLIVVFPLLTLFVGKFIWDLLYKNWVKKTVLTLMIAIFLVADYYQYSIPIKKYDYKETANYLEHDIKDARPILFYRGSIAPILEYYYHGKSKLYPLPDYSCYKTNFLASIKSENQLDSTLRTFGTSSFCLVADEQIVDKYSVDYRRPMIYEYLKNRSVIEQDTIFFGRARRYYLRITKFTLTKI